MLTNVNDGRVTDKRRGSESVTFFDGNIGHS